MGNPVKRIERRSRRTLLTALLRARFRYGGKSEALIDADGRRMTYNEIVQAAFAIGSVLASQTKRGEKVGVLLPTGAGAMIAFFALQAFGRVPAMLNFTAGALNIKAACTAAEVTKIITANQFIELAQLGQLEDDLAKDFSFIYLEDVRAGIGGKDKAAAVLGPFVSWVSRIYTKSTDPGVILFTSGTEGLPKGVVLTHANVLANIEQINAHVTTSRTTLSSIRYRRSIAMG